MNASKPGPASDMLVVANRAADAAASVHRDSAGSLDPSGWTQKGRSDFATDVDVEAERRIVETILGAFPDHAVLAEEGGDHGGEDVRWIVDPLDGTTNWLHGYPEYAVSIAAQDHEGLVVAVVLNSATGERFEAVRGAGAWRDGESIRVSGLEDASLALVGTGFPFKQLDMLDAYLATFSTVLRSTAGIRRAGAAALDLCDVACGRLDAFFEFHLMPWDVAAGALIIREAGGWFHPLRTTGGVAPTVDDRSSALPVGGYVAGCPGLKDAFLELITRPVDPARRA